jgi:hypothetical protein
MLFWLVCFLCIGYGCWRWRTQTMQTWPGANKETKKMLRRKCTQKDCQDADFDVVIVGAGVTGLVLGALQAKAGKRVLLLEQNEVVGGGLHTFKKGKGRPSHDTGLHYVGSSVEADLARLLGQRVRFNPIHSVCGLRDQVYDIYCGPDFTWRLPAGKAGFVRSLAPLLSGGTAQARLYLSHICWTARLSRLVFLLRAAEQTWFPSRWQALTWLQSKILGRRLELTVDQYLTRVLNFTERDKRVVLSMCFNYGNPNETSWMVHAGVVEHFLDGALYPSDGPDDISLLCLDLIRRAGGKALCQAGCVSLEKRGNLISSVVLSRGWKLNLKPRTRVVSTVGSTNLEWMLGQDIVPESHLQFTFLFVEFEVPALAWCRTANTWITVGDDSSGRIFVSSGTLKQFQHTLGIMAATVIGAGLHYRPTIAELRSAFKQVYPGAVIVEEFQGDAKTCQKYLGRLTPYGMTAHPQRLSDPKTATRTAYQNLFRAGQDSLLPGIAGAIGSAELTHFVLSHS